jgi:hypothetical protein
MTTATQFPVDAFADLANGATQRLAARMAQDVFAGVFRLAVSAEREDDVQVLAELVEQCDNWCRAGGRDNAYAARLALLVSGLDAWGLAYTQAFHLAAIPALTAVIGGLRTRLDTPADARFQQQFAVLSASEFNAVDFKVELRRAIHLALWHAMAACETARQAEAILQPLGSLMLGLNEQMPELGWRLIADALASMQISLLADPKASLQAQVGTQQLFEALRHALPAERYQAIAAHAGQALIAWQQARRGQAAQQTERGVAS